MRRRALGIACLGGVLVITTNARAEPTPEDQALATTLFREAKALLDQERASDACPKLEESMRLYPAGGTLLNLAVCHEKEGKLASAWAEFREARVIALREGRDDRVTLADEHMKAVEPKLSKLVIVVSREADLPGIEVTTDARPLRRPAWATPFPVNPGEHVIEATAPGKKRWRQAITIGREADAQTITIPAFEDEPAPAGVVTPEPTSSPVNQSPPPERRSRTPAIIAGAIAVSALVVGSISGIRAIAKHDEASTLCTRDPCEPAAESANDSAETAADVSTVAFAIGAVALGVSVFLWLTSSSAPSKSPSRAVIAPSPAFRF